MQDFDDTPVQRPRWIGWVIIIGMVLVVLGLLNLGLRLIYGTSSDQDNAAKVDSVAQANPALVQGKIAIDGSDCMRCHGVDRRFVGPGFVEVADRYRDKPEAIAYLAGKIRDGSVGEWGRTIMPRHPQVTQAQAEHMAAWIVALPPAPAPAAAPIPAPAAAPAAAPPATAPNA